MLAEFCHDFTRLRPTVSAYRTRGGQGSGAGLDLELKVQRVAGYRGASFTNQHRGWLVPRNGMRRSPERVSLPPTTARSIQSIRAVLDALRKILEEMLADGRTRRMARKTHVAFGRKLQSIKNQLFRGNPLPRAD